MIDIKLSDTKQIKFKSWEGKERRELQKIINEESNKKIEDVLIYDCMINNKVYLTKKQINYILFEMYIDSYKSSIINGTCECSFCTNEEDKDIDLNKIIDEEKVEPIFSEFVFENNEDIIKFKFNEKFSLTEIFYNRQKNEQLDVDKLFNELIICTPEIFINDEEIIFDSFEKRNEFIDKLPIDIFDKLFTEFTRQSFDFTPIFRYKCKKCKEENIIVIDIINEIVSRFV